MNKTEIVESIKSRHNLKDADIGVIGGISTKTFVDVEKRLIRATAMTSFVDLDNEVVVPSGIDWSYLDINKKILVDHKNDMDHLVGHIMNRKATTRIVNGQLEIADWQILVHVLPLTKNKYCDDILIIAEQAGVGMSIGFQILEKGRPTTDEILKYNKGIPFNTIVRRCKLLEVSFVALPCNVEAQSANNTPLKPGPMGKNITDLATKNIILPETCKLFGLDSLITPKNVTPTGRKIIVLG